VPEVTLHFALGADRTSVRSRLRVKRNGCHSRDLRLDRDGITPLEVRVDGKDATARWRLEADALLIDLPNNDHVIETEVVLTPITNSQLMGLFASGRLLCTQCEAQGFRRITFFPDRPDILSQYTVRLEADLEHYPVLLSNGDKVDAGFAGHGRHYAVWRDTLPKPSYLFALVAGDLARQHEQFVTRSGRTVDLELWAGMAELGKTGHAMASLKAAMAWDEIAYGREYDLKRLNIVAVPDVHFGAMENKGLNIFDSRYILADPETASDDDYSDITRIVAHEYFHNWSGNRVTCRDWFQLSLKEGFTVFRDQQFSADQGSRTVERIEDVRILRATQFPEDAGPLAHPIRPDSYIEIANFYTKTVYRKGAEVIRMLRLILGADAFRAGADLFFDRHDGQAVTCEDFIICMEDASGRNLRRFRLWYSQAGTPCVVARLETPRSDGHTRLSLTQSIPSTPGQAIKEVMPIPLKLRLLGLASGRPLGDEHLVILESETTEIDFGSLPEVPILSINRSFSAPIHVEIDRSIEELAFLSRHDDDLFARYETIQELMRRTMVQGLTDQVDWEAATEAVRHMLIDPTLEAAFVSHAVTRPTQASVGYCMTCKDPELIGGLWDELGHALGASLSDIWRDIHTRLSDVGPYIFNSRAKGTRRLRVVALNYLAASCAPAWRELALAHYVNADNMTDRYGALAVLVGHDVPERAWALNDFHARHIGNTLAMDKWFAVQALASAPDTLDIVERLVEHQDFSPRNPNRVRALVENFSTNQRFFHHPSGRGYRLLADMIMEVDPLNAQAAARLVSALGSWREFEPARGSLMKAALECLLAKQGLSKDVFEQVSKSLP
jgi:aminopeptidase N